MQAGDRMKQMDELELKIYNTFLEHAEFDARDNIGAVSDKIFAGMFKRTIKAHLSPTQVSRGLREGYLKKTHLAPKKKEGLKAAYLYVGQEMKQRKWWKKFFVSLMFWRK